MTQEQVYQINKKKLLANFYDSILEKDIAEMADTITDDFAQEMINILSEVFDSTIVEDAVVEVPQPQTQITRDIPYKDFYNISMGFGDFINSNHSVQLMYHGLLADNKVSGLTFDRLSSFIIGALSLYTQQRLDKITLNDTVYPVNDLVKVFFEYNDLPDDKLQPYIVKMIITGKTSRQVQYVCVSTVGDKCCEKTFNQGEVVKKHQFWKYLRGCLERKLEYVKTK